MRKLTLTKETLVELTTDDLIAVVGGATLFNLCGGPTFTLTCWSEVDACVTAQICAR